MDLAESAVAEEWHGTRQHGSLDPDAQFRWVNQIKDHAAHIGLLSHIKARELIAEALNVEPQPREWSRKISEMYNILSANRRPGSLPESSPFLWPTEGGE
jgi:hypothetical protein